MTPEWRATAVDGALLALSAGMLWLALITRDPTIRMVGTVVLAVDLTHWGRSWWKRWRFGDDNSDDSGH